MWARNDICKWPVKGWPILNDSYVMIQKTCTPNGVSPIIQSKSVQITSMNCEELVIGVSSHKTPPQMLKAGRLPENIPLRKTNTFKKDLIWF